MKPVMESQIMFLRKSRKEFSEARWKEKSVLEERRKKLRMKFLEGSQNKSAEGTKEGTHKRILGRIPEAIP